MAESTNNPAPRVVIGERLLSRNALMEKLGVSRSQLWMILRRPDFPKPRDLGERSQRWLESEVEEWMHNLEVAELPKEVASA